ncbi:MAG: hypothetical protein ABIS86_22655 [Streptosporangiaceae bacterium]
MIAQANTLVVNALLSVVHATKNGGSVLHGMTESRAEVECDTFS